MYTIYHNPRCSKSRQTLELLKQHNIEPTVVLYLDEELTISKLKEIATLLNKKAIEFTRTKEAAFKEANLTKESSDDEIFEAMIKFPKLIERPIVIKGKKAVLGRPPENVLDLM